MFMYSYHIDTIDEALTVKRAIKTSSSTSALIGTLPVVQKGPAKPDARLEAFMDKVSDSAFTASAYFPPMTPPAPPSSGLRAPIQSGSPYKSIASLGTPAIPVTRGVLRIPNPPASKSSSSSGW